MVCPQLWQGPKIGILKVNLDTYSETATFKIARILQKKEYPLYK
jgi:hypothetical protein